MEGKDERVKYWIDLSDYDLETAEAMLTTARYLYVGFMCHQAVEKLMKGHYAAVTGQSPLRTHNLSYIAKESGVYEQLNEDRKDLLDLLEPLNIEARYPTYKERILDALTRERCEVLIAKTKELAKWIKGLL